MIALWLAGMVWMDKVAEIKARYPAIQQSAE